MELILTIKIYHSSFMQLFDNTGKSHWLNHEKWSRDLTI